MCGALFALDLILLYHFVSTFIVPLPIFARPFDLLLGFLFPSLPAFSTSMFLPFLPFCLVPILVPSLLLLPLSSPSNLISLRPFILLLLCPPHSIPYFSFFMSSFPRYHSGAGGSSPLSPRFSSLVSSIDIENPLLLISDARQKYDPFPSSVFSSLPQIANASSSSAYPLCTGAAFTFFLLGHVIPNHCSRNVSSEVEHSLSVVSVFFFLLASMYILVPHMVLYPSSLPITLSSLRTLWVHLLLAAVQTNVGLSFHSTWMSAVCTRKTEASFLASPFFPPLVLTLIP